jgi:hypothetical protein
VFAFGLQKSSLQKSSASYFFNLTLQAREARGAAQNQWTSLGEVHWKNPNLDLVATAVATYYRAQTFFSKNQA